MEDEERPRKKQKGNNEKMHSRNIYKNNPPNFSQLAIKYPEFKKYVFTNKQGNPSIDWKDPFAVRELTFTLLKHDFQLEVEWPIDQLNPTVTNRSNYIHWLHDLIGDRDSVRGIDIGTGASCIYPLLGTRIYNWNFIATDIDNSSLAYALKNIKKNHFEDKIECRLVKKRQLLINVLKDDERFDFCMCNPPFFEDLEQTGLSNKTVCTGTENEMVTEGGEQNFVKKMIEESEILRDRIKWYTSMLGRKASLKVLLAELRRRNISNIRKTEFYQGRTTRWAIGWSFSDEGMNGKDQKVVLSSKVGQNKLNIKCEHPKEFLEHVDSLLSKFGIKSKMDKTSFSLQAQVCDKDSKENKEEEVLLYRFEMQMLLVSGIEYLVEFKFKGDSSHKEKFFDLISQIGNSWKTK